METDNTATETIKVRKDQLKMIESAKESEWEPNHVALDRLLKSNSLESRQNKVTL